MLVRSSRSSPNRVMMRGYVSSRREKNNEKRDRASTGLARPTRLARQHSGRLDKAKCISAWRAAMLLGRTAEVASDLTRVEETYARASR